MLSVILSRAKEYINRSIFGSEDYQRSYAQSGEDVIIRRILRRLGLAVPLYLDIGANHPIKLSNSYLLYHEGGRGVLVEPDESLCKVLRQIRPRDTVLNVGIGLENEVAGDLYVFDNRALSTFSAEKAREIENQGKNRILDVVPVPMLNINAVIRKQFDAGPHFINIDVEGMDLEILKEIDFNMLRPEVICLETIKYTQDNTEQKRMEIFEFLQNLEYMAYADTYINTIFVDQTRWRTR